MRGDFLYNLSGKLKHKIDIYGKMSYTDELGSKNYRYEKVKSVWAAIVPILGERARAIKAEKKGNTVKISETIKFIMRINAIIVEPDMYFIYRGQRYDVDYAVPYFKDMQYQEVYTQLVIENDNNLPGGDYL